MTTIDANTPEYITFYFKRHTQDGVDLGRDGWVLANKTILVAKETIHSHAGSPGLHSATSATLANGYPDIPDIAAITPIVSYNVQDLLLAIQFDDARAFSTTELDSLGGDDL